MLQNALTPAEPLGAKLKKDPQMTHAMPSHALGGAKIRGSVACAKDLVYLFQAHLGDDLEHRAIHQG